MEKDPRFDTDKYEPFFLFERPVKWAKVFEPDTKFKSQWCIDVVLDDKAKEVCKKAGFNIKLDKEGDWILRCKKSTHTAKGKAMQPPRILGKNREPFNEAIGNGSICNIKLTTKYITVSGKTYLPAYLDSVMVVKHEKYEGKSDGFPKYEDDTDSVPF